MEHRRVCFCMLSLLPLVQISKLSQANSLLFGKVCCRTPRGVRGLKSDGFADNKIPIFESHPSRGAWIEISNWRRIGIAPKSRTPRGVRGLKSLSAVWACCNPCPSHPSRGAWIEIDWEWHKLGGGRGRTPRGVRGLKLSESLLHLPEGPCRTPRGVRGLKCFAFEMLLNAFRSHPSRGAWIEIG